jgi:hypothetical protein
MLIPILWDTTTTCGKPTQEEWQNFVDLALGGPGDPQRKKAWKMPVVMDVFAKRSGLAVYLSV